MSQKQIQQKNPVLSCWPVLMDYINNNPLLHNIIPFFLMKHKKCWCLPNACGYTVLLQSVYVKVTCKNWWFISFSSISLCNNLNGTWINYQGTEKRVGARISYVFSALFTHKYIYIKCSLKKQTKIICRITNTQSLKVQHFAYW